MTSPDVRERLTHALDQRYRIERELGSGGMATVFLAHDLRHDRPVALKVMKSDVALILGRERFLREIRLAARLSHPHILGVHDSGDADGLLYYVMPFVDGETLRQRLERDPRLPIAEAIDIARQVADALGYAHATGIVHRDIKPENILLARGHAMVADLGIASALNVARDDRLTATGVSLGTPAYMSPEQSLGEQVDARADVWALGCVLYEMLTGAPPFGTDVRQVLPRVLTTRPAPVRNTRDDVPAFVQRVVENALARSLDDRFPTGTEMAAALSGARMTTSRSSVGWRDSRVRLALGVVAAIAVLVATGSVLRNRASSVASPASSSAGAGAKRARAALSNDSLARQFYFRGRAQVARRTQASAVDALNLFSQAIQRDSSFAAAWAGLSGTAQFVIGRGFTVPGRSRDSMVSIVVRASERAVELDSSDADIWLVRARAASTVDPTDQTARLYAVRRALALDSTNADAWFALGMIREEVLDPGNAEAAWLRAKSIDPKHVQVLAFLALHHLWIGDYARGVPFADSAIALDPTYILAREAAGQLALELGRIDDAERQFRAYLSLTAGPEQVNAYTMLTRVALARGDSIAARRYAAKAASLANPRNPTNHEAPLVGMAMAAIGDTATAIKWISAYQPRGDLHFQLHLKRDPGLKWLHGPPGKGLLLPDPKAP